jgi:hypothetical protein
MTAPTTPAEKKEIDEELTEALEESFPGSDPLSVTQPVTPGGPDHPPGQVPPVRNPA